MIESKKHTKNREDEKRQAGRQRRKETEEKHRGKKQTERQNRRVKEKGLPDSSVNDVLDIFLSTPIKHRNDYSEHSHEITVMTNLVYLISFVSEEKIDKTAE